MPDFLRFSPPAQRIIVLLLAMATFLMFIGNRDIATSHEARVAQTARQMADSGWPWAAKKIAVPTVQLVVIDGKKQLRPAINHQTMEVNPWLVPVMNGQIRLQKPPLPYWCAAITFRLFGVGEGWARLVPALLGVIATLLIYELAEMLLGRRAGFIAAAVWLTTGHFIVDEYRKAMADPYLAFFTLLAIWAWVAIAHSKTGGMKKSGVGVSPAQNSMRQRGRDAHATILLSIFYIALGFGFLAKGPVIFITVGLALVGYHLFYRSRIGSLAGHLLGLILFVFIAAPWFAYCLRHVPHALDLWRYESVGEVSGENVEKARPWWMYIGNAFEISLPWTPLWIGGIVIAFIHIRRTGGQNPWRRRGLLSPRGRRRMVAIAWYALIIVFFSVTAVKKKAYLLPAMPAQTLIITDAILILLAFAKRRLSPSVVAATEGRGEGLSPSPGTPGEGRGEGRTVPLKVAQFAEEREGPHPNPLPAYRARGQEPFSGMPGMLAMAQALIGVGAAVRIAMLLMHARHDRVIGIVCGIVSIVLCLFALIPIIRHRARCWLAMQVIAYAALTLVLLGFQRAEEQNARSAKEFAHALADYLPTQNLPLMVHWLPEEASFYLPLNIPDAGDSPYALMVVDHSPKDPPESPPWFSDLMGDVRVIDSRQVDLHGPDGGGRWKLFELTMDRMQQAKAE